MQNYSNENIEQAYKEALELAGEHYENFPVVSIFLPKPLRRHVGLVYYFARKADDIADEGALTPDERIAQLNEMAENLENALKGNYKNSYWFVLADTIRKFNITPDNLFNLLVAFKQDVTKKRFANFDEILDYCSNSANPVGRIILEFFDIRSDEALKHSDEICTALQLANFYQDVSVDILKNRIYVPLDEIESFGYSEEQYMNNIYNSEFRKLMDFQVKRAEKLFLNGERLVPLLPKNLRVQIIWTMLGGKKILEKVTKIEFKVLNYRPKLSKMQYLLLMLKAIIKRYRYAE